MIIFFLQNYFPEPIRVVFLLKPEGVLQRALEVGYRNFAENGKFKVSRFFFSTLTCFFWLKKNFEMLKTNNFIILKLKKKDKSFQHFF